MLRDVLIEIVSQALSKPAVISRHDGFENSSYIMGGDAQHAHARDVVEAIMAVMSSSPWPPVTNSTGVRTEGNIDDGGDT